MLYSNVPFLQTLLLFFSILCRPEVVAGLQFLPHRLQYAALYTAGELADQRGNQPDGILLTVLPDKT